MSVVNRVISRRHVPFRRAGRPRHHFLPAEETFHVSPQVVSPGFAEQVGAEQLVDVSAEGNVTGKEPRVKEDTVTHPSSTGHAGRDFSPEAAEFSQPKFTDATTQVHSLAEIDADELAPRSCKAVASSSGNQGADAVSRGVIELPVWKEIIEFLEGKKLPRRALPASLHEFELDDGVLYHLKSLPDRIIRQVCVPHSLQSQALHLAHDHPTAAHPGALRTYHNLQNSYFFPNMFRLCKWYVQHCTACQHRKGSRERAEMQCRPPPSGPLELVSADLMDLRASVGGYRYVLSIVDHHSRGLTNQVTTDTNLRVQQLAKARQLAIAASLRSREANAQAHNRKVRSTWQPEEGALVLRRDFTGGALQDRWQGVDGPLPGRPPDVAAAPVRVLMTSGMTGRNEFSNRDPEQVS
ncbi:hypothetical protein C7M84_013405 [Penaeus vannamei]|uniref:Integrase zinc-binding domain-containing protein n=1 Tax=Penaeus vannamei TaxID=6689 RepID=A0A423SWD9_PENVA|nr:hypothetical protein C7M84_013405 [Penaeus vannamei]